jgi:amidase
VTQEEPGVARVAELVRSGAASPREVVEQCLERIARLDPALNAFRVVLAGEALAAADGPLPDGPLRGVPIAVKDDTDVAGEVTALGTAAVQRRATADAPVVAALRAAGAIVVGKTNLPELALWGTFTESATWGRTANPHDPARTPGGSSGGSAAAVASGMVPAATGTDGGASIRVPAALCGLVGVKPQRGRLGPPRWRGLLQDGFLTRSVGDAALLLGVAPPAAPPRLRIAVSTRAGVPWARIDPQARAAVERTAERLRALGHDVAERDPAYARVAPLAVPRMMRGVHEEARRLDEPHRLEPRTRAFLRLGGLVPRRLADLLEARSPQTDPLFADHDLLLTPVTATTAPPLGQYDGRGAIRTYLGTTSFFSTLPAWNLTGQPAASVPAGLGAGGLPLGVQLVSRPHGEATLLAVAAELEAPR